MSNTNDCYPRIHEEWRLRFSKVKSRLDRHNESDDKRQEPDNASAQLYSASMAVRAGSVGAVLCSLVDDLDIANEKALSQLLRKTKLEADEISVMEPKARRSVIDFAGSPEMTERNVSVDDVFLDYSELIRNDTDVLSDDDESDSEEDDDTKQNKADTTHIEQHQLTETEPYKGNQISQRNPYARQTQTKNNTVPPITTKTPKAWEEMDSRGAKFDRSQRAILPNSWEDVDTSLRGASKNRSVSSSMTNAPNEGAYINGASSWDALQNKQNPFQTAREYGEADENANGGDMEETRQGNGSYSRTKSCYNEDGPVRPNNPYVSRGDEHLQQNEAQSQVRGPNIPDSLKRKFQPPRRNQNDVSFCSL